MYKGVFYSSDNGQSWSQFYENFAKTLFVHDNYLYAGTGNHSTWRRPLPPIIGIKKTNNNIPFSFNLSQNYPNPFNPSTIITYQIPVNTNVKLSIYDITGKEVSTIFNGKQAAGIYQYTWDGTKYSSGVYIFKLETENYSASKKMVLLK